MEHNENKEIKKKPDGAPAEGGNSSRSGRNRRHHRHGRPDQRKPQDASNAQAQAHEKGESAKGEERPPRQKQNNKNRDRKASQGQGQEPAQKPQKNNKPSGEQKNEKKEGDNGKKNRRGGRRHDGKKKNDNQNRLYDPYEAVTPAEMSLDELRSRIVLRPSDAKVEQPVEEPVNVSLRWEEVMGGAAPQGEPVEEEVERVEIVGIRFRSAAKTYYFDPHGIQAKKGEFAIVETARGPEFGEVSIENTRIKASEVVSPLRPVIRIASQEDIRHHEENRSREGDALKLCAERIAAHKLDMKLIDVQYAFDNSKLLFYFTSEGRVDFRDLVKDLASLFRTRIELRQIGIRDEAKMLGGIGACGRPLCCATFLPDFAQVSIKMAKEQGLSLNSAKISGVCGRLMCCLRYETESYAAEIKLTPPVDSTVKTEDGVGTVIGTNPIAGTVKVLLSDTPDTPPKQYHRDSVTVLSRKGDRAKGAKGDKPTRAEKQPKTEKNEDGTPEEA